MERVKQFLVADGAIVALGLLFFLWTFLRKSPASQFREDLWKDIKDPAKRAQAKAAFEDQVDKKILLEHRPLKGEEPSPPPAAAAPPEFKIPNFRGKAHEILGIPVSADALLINKAHKHWIKRYHPDRVTHLGATYIEQARQRAEQLNTARQQLLKNLSSPKN